MKRKLIVFLLGSLLILSGCSKEECENVSNEHIMYVTNGVLIRFEFSEQYDKCFKGDEKYNKNESTVITNFELLNDETKTTFNNVDFKNKSLEDALNLLEEVASNNELEISEINIYTTLDKDYSSYVSYKVNTKVLDKDEIDSSVNKPIPINRKFELKVIVGMEYYFEYLEFISDTEVKFSTKYACYGECDVNETYKYTSYYNIETDKILITLDDGYDSKYTYSFKDDTLKYGNNVNEK